MRNKRTAYFLSSLLVAFAMSAVGSVQNFQPLEQNLPSIGKSDSGFSNPWKTEYDALSRPVKSVRPTGAEEQNEPTRQPTALGVPTSENI